MTIENVWTKDPKDMLPAEFEAWQKEDAERRRKEAAEHAERLRKDRARRAFMESGGAEDAFEQEWPGIRKHMINAETMKRLQGDEPAVGSINPDGMVRW
jgi:isocitrate dehydrogenase kinase/phosphatase